MTWYSPVNTVDTVWSGELKTYLLTSLNVLMMDASVNRLRCGWTLCPVNTCTILHHPYCCYVLYIPGTTRLHISLAHLCLYYYLLSPQYTVLNNLFDCTFYSLFLFIFLPIFIYIFSCVVLHLLHCPLSGPDLIYISLRIIFCMIEYVMNK